MDDFTYRMMLNHRSFDPHIIKVMNDAYDRIIQDFPDAPQNEKRIVRTILALAMSGEHDATKLSQFALLSLFDSDQ